jgi:hypothetical protein
MRQPDAIVVDAQTKDVSKSTWDALAESIIERMNRIRRGNAIVG